MTEINEAEFERRFGYAPKNDDLERVNCEHAGDAGHYFCGVCIRCDKPRMICGHFVCLFQGEQP